VLNVLILIAELVLRNSSKINVLFVNYVFVMDVSKISENVKYVKKPFVKIVMRAARNVKIIFAILVI
jgi:hypothetical protein